MLINDGSDTIMTNTLVHIIIISYNYMWLIGYYYYSKVCQY